MTENLKKFIEEASKNEELKAKLAGITDKDAVIEQSIGIAKEFGYELTAEDFDSADNGDLSVEELNMVVGGASFSCILTGKGENVKNQKEKKGCSCIMQGYGDDDSSCTWSGN
jgi:predicted ribosomally synthesized peptide with nif11-like leader